jgi:hypothetical protein
MIEPDAIIAEKVELDERRQKLGAFVAVAYHTLPSVEWSRLNQQHRVMLEYSQILSQRIKAFCE